ncbi:hypothetical protein Dimus_014105 [Dionaea muscipula]
MMQDNKWIPPPGFRPSKSAPCSPAKPLGISRTRSETFHIAHKVPLGDTPYVRAKHVQLVDKDPEKAIPLFWAAINAGDRVDSALKDMAIVMKQQNRADEAIEAIKSLRNRCSDQAQESLDNILLDLYKRCGRLDDQIALLRHKLYLIQQGLAFNGKRTKTARSQGKKFQVSVEQEATRLLGNLGWALMQQNSYIEAEDAYRRALSIAPDNNKMCNLGICLMKQGRISEAKDTLRLVKPASAADGPRGVDSHLKAYERAQEMLQDLESERMKKAGNSAVEEQIRLFNIFLGSSSIWQPQPCKDHHHQLLLPLPTGIKSQENEYPDENENAANNANILRNHHHHHHHHDNANILRSSSHHEVVHSLNIDAAPFYSSKFVGESMGSGTTHHQLHESTLKRTRPGNTEKPTKANHHHHLQHVTGQHKIRRRSLSFEDGPMVDLLPDDKEFEEAMISTAVLNYNNNGVLQRKIDKRFKVFEDITRCLSPRGLTLFQST